MRTQMRFRHLADVLFPLPDRPSDAFDVFYRLIILKGLITSGVRLGFFLFVNSLCYFNEPFIASSSVWYTTQRT